MRSERYSRRALLKGLGVGMGMLPLLNSERVRAQSGGVAKRLIAIAWTNGVATSTFYPPAGALTAALPASLAPLEMWKSKMLIIGGKSQGGIDSQVMVDANNRFGGHSNYPSLLTGTAKGTQASIDTLYANQLAMNGFPKAQLNVGCRPSGRGISWAAGGHSNTAETDPYRLFTTLFSGTTMTPVQMSNLMQRDKSILDFCVTELTAFQNRIGTDDKSRVQAHLDSIRTIENQLSSASSTPSAGCAPPANTPAGLNFKTVTNYPDHVRLMMNLVAAAVKCDIARSITMELIDDGGGNSLTFPWINIPSPDYHAIAHKGPGDYADKTPIDAWWFTQVANLVGQLAANPEGGSTSLDNSVVLTVNDMNEGANHDVTRLPYMIIGSGGGFFKQGMNIQLAKNAQNNQILTSVLHAMGVNVASVGDTYTGDLDSMLKA